MWISAAWDVWQHHQDEKRAISAIGRGMDDKAIQREEGLEAIRRLLTLRDVSHVAVSTWDIRHRLDQWVRDDRVSRPATSTSDAAARPADDGELVERIGALVREALGNEELPPDGDIFEAGGDSLLIVRLLSQVRDQFSVEVPLADVLADPTPAAMAELVRTRLEAKGSQDPVDDIAALVAELSLFGEAEIEALLAGTGAAPAAEQER